MANFCGNCGAPATSTGQFCTSCGQPIEGSASPDRAATGSQPPVPAAEPAQPAPEPAQPTTQPTTQGTPEPTAAPTPEQPPAPPRPDPGPPTTQVPGGSGQYAAPPPPAYAPQPGYGYPGQPAPAPAAPAVPRVNPFAGVPVSDYVRDAAAALCLFACLGMPWDIGNDGADRWWVVLSVLVAVLSLALPYVGKARLVPGWTHQHVQLAKLAAAVPFLASLLAAVVNELIHLGDFFDGGFGTGIGMGMAGVFLALQPRQADETPAHADDRTWNLLTNAMVVASVAVGVLAFAAFVLDDLIDRASLFDDLLSFMALTLIYPVFFLLVIGWPALRMLDGNPAWRRVFATAAFTHLVVSLFAIADDGDGLFASLVVEKWNTPYAGTFVLGAAAALAVTRAQVRLGSRRAEPVMSWITTAAAALMVSAVALAVPVVVLVLAVIDREEVEPALVVVVVLALVSAVALVVARSMLSDVRRNRTAVLGIVGMVLLLSVISLGVDHGQEVGFPATGWAIAMWFTLPALAAYALAGPAEVRAALGPLVAPRSYPPAAPYGGYPAAGQQAPGYPPAPPAAQQSWPPQPGPSGTPGPPPPSTG